MCKCSHKRLHKLKHSIILEDTAYLYQTSWMQTQFGMQRILCHVQLTALLSNTTGPRCCRVWILCSVSDSHGEALRMLTWQEYLGSVLRSTAWPYPGTTLPDLSVLLANSFTSSALGSSPSCITYQYGISRIMPAQGFSCAAWSCQLAVLGTQCKQLCTLQLV